MAVLRKLTKRSCSTSQSRAPPPDREARDQEQLRNDQHGQVEDRSGLVAAELDARGLQGTRTYRDELLLSAEPAHRVQEEISVVQGVDVLVVGEGGRAVHDEARLALAETELGEVGGHGDADRHRARLVGRIEARLALL